jgi:hypothetical protein
MCTRRFFICILFAFLFAPSYGQKTCWGIVVNYDTKEPVAFASVWIKNTNKGGLTQLDGSFSINMQPSDTLMITSVGYQDYSLPYKMVQPLILTVELIPSAIFLDVSVVRPGPNLAIPIVRNAIKNRRTNRPNALEDLVFMEYNKLNINFSEIDSSVFQSNFLSKHPDILVKANDYDSTWSLPLYFSERLTVETRAKNTTPTIVEIAKNQHGSVFLNSDITQKYIASLNEDMTFYGNIRFLMRDFISPLSVQAVLFYEYYLIDSLLFDDAMYYQIRFKPKNPQDLAFVGYMIIENKTWALTEIQASLQPSANLNYVKKIQIHEQFQKYGNAGWFHKHQKLDVLFVPQVMRDTTLKFLNTPLHAIKTTSYVLDSVLIHDHLLSYSIPERFQTRKQHSRDTLVLSQFRPDSLSTLDLRTRDAIEVSNAIPAIAVTNKLLDMFLYGYLPLGKIELGPYLYFIQHNEIEGFRYNLAMRTSPQFHKKMMIGGYVGYGSRDKNMRYGATYALKLPSALMQIIHIKYDQNIYRIGDYKQNLDFIRENVLVQSDDNMLSAFTSKEPNMAVYAVEKASFAFEHQIHRDVIVKPKIEISKHISPSFYPLDTISIVANFRVREASCNFRFSFNEEVSNNHFRRMYIDSRYPVFHVNLAHASYVYDSEFGQFSQLRFVSRHAILFGVGRLRYVIEAGLLTASVPYPLLEFHRGNQTGSSGEYYFNLMEYLEFASDRFVNVYAEYGMNGFILNKVPVIKRLKLRELLTFKACWGDMKHAPLFVLPTHTSVPTIPYIEAGVGLTNVLKIIRLEYIWRLNHIQEDVSKSGFFFRFQFEF